MNEQFPRFYVQGESVRGEPRVYWVVDRQHSHRTVSNITTRKKTADRWRDRIAADAATDGQSAAKEE